MKRFAEARKVARILGGTPRRRRRDEGLVFGIHGPLKRAGKTAILSASIPADMRARLAEAALAENRTLSNFVRVLLEGAIRRCDFKRPDWASWWMKQRRAP